MYLVKLLFESNDNRIAFLLLCMPTQEEMNRGKPNWEHLNEDLHVLITVEDAQNRATIRLKKGADEVRKLLVPLVSACVRSRRVLLD